MKRARTVANRQGSQLHQPGLAELVAGELRSRILNGDMQDGDLLDSQDSLLTEFRISRAPLREALRILETEGLITVLRGKVGGSVVHRPDARHAAYTLSLVLQARQATLDDVGAALNEMEGMCAGLAAARTDRHEVVVPILTECNERTRAALGDQLAYVEAASDFHRELVSACGNTTVQLVVGSLQALWLSHIRTWAEESTRDGRFPDYAYRKQGLDAHVKIVKYIANGDSARATKISQGHFDGRELVEHDPNHTRRVDAAILRSPGRLFNLTMDSPAV
jgi:DNA-binding FadR family transcriptional regulator